MSCIDPTTPAAELMRRARGERLPVGVRRWLMRHPQLPLEALMKFGPGEPEAFFQHPMVRLLLAADAAFVKSLPPRLKLYLVRSSKWCGPETLRKLAGRSASLEIKLAAAKSPKLPDNLAASYRSDTLEVRLVLAQNQALSPDLVTHLARDRDAPVRAVVASRSGLTAALAKGLARDGRDQVRWALAGNRQCPPPALEALVEDEKPAIRVRARWALGLPWGNHGSNQQSWVG